jgi:hypothetical protein
LAEGKRKRVRCTHRDGRVCGTRATLQHFDPPSLVIGSGGAQYEKKCDKRRGCEGHMDELVGRLVANVGVDRTVAEKSIGIILDFLVKEGPAEKVQPLMDQLPGAEALQQQAASQGGGMFGMGGIMGAGTRLMGLGLSMGQVQGVTREVIAYSREKAGEDTVGEIVASIPGLGQFV